MRETASKPPALRRAGWAAWNVLVALSLLCCMATLGAWLRSNWVRDTVGFGWEGGNSHIAQSILGRLHVLTSLGGGCGGGASYMADRLSRDAIWSGGMSGYPPEVRWRLGFVCQTYDRSSTGPGPIVWTSQRLIVVPYWSLVVLFLLAPIAWVSGVRRRVGWIDLLLIVAATALILALPAFLARSMNPARGGPG